MSTERNLKAPATTKVYEHSTAAGRHFEMLMSVAVFANPDGTSCFPSVAKITDKRFGATARYGYKLIADLKAAGELEEVEKRPGRPTEYRIVCCTEQPSPGLPAVLDQRRAERREKALTPDPQESGVQGNGTGQGYPGPPGVTPTPDSAESPNHPRDHPGTTTTGGSSSLVGGDSISTSTTDGAGAVEEEPFDNHVNQKKNLEHDPPSSLAELETSRPRDEAEANGSNQGEGVRAAQEDLLAEVQAARDKYPARNVGELLVQWRRHEDEAGLLTYCKLRAGVGRRRVLKPHEAEAEAFPQAEAVAA